MKTLADGTQVSARSYYYLLDWNEKDNWQFMRNELNEQQLCKLSRVQYKRLFNKATSEELNQL